MAEITRRNFFKSSLLLGAGMAGMSPSKAKAGEKKSAHENRMGVLVDTTLCVGCRRCEWACKTSHNMDAGNIADYDDKSVMEKMRRPDHTGYTVVNSFDGKNPVKEINVKVQCMHCNEPACVSACIVGAFTKHEGGQVTWDTGKCIGCRYCMIACPFQVPAFEYHKAIEPDIVKCDFCYEERTSKGKLPACVEICPMEVMTYGRRDELIGIAREKIRNNPGRYADHIYGEYEVGGTSWMYLTPVDHTKLAFPQLDEDAAPGVSESIQHGIFAYFIPPIALYALLGGIMYISKEKEGEKNES